MAGKLISDLNSGTLSLADAMEIDKDVSGTRTSFKTTVKDIVDFANHNVADEYDSTSTYAIGDYVMYESTLYKCITAVSSAENFDSTKWTAVLVTDEMGSGGGGGTGGHTIIDENGNSMPARAGLQFVGGANVSDDATNNKTIVDIASAGGIDGVFIDTDNLISSGTLSNSGTTSYTATEDCYFVGYSSSGNALAYLIDNVTMIFAPTNQTHSLLLKKGQTLTVGEASTYSISYKIYGIQTGTTHSKFQPVIYSTEEREIGVWIDGKPLYEKTFTFSQIQSGADSWFNTGVDISSLNIEVFGDTKLIASSTGGNIIYDGISSRTSNDTLQCMHFRNANANFIGAIVQYTKSTDTAGSGSWTPQGVPTHHYSEDEQVIGTWIDGSTLYEKTIDFGALPNNNSKSVNHNISNLDKIISINGIAIRTDGDTIPIPHAHYSTIANQLQVSASSTTVNVRVGSDASNRNGYITIQYTKSS